MKKTIVLFATLIIAYVSCFASIPADHPKLNEYFSKRFVNLVYAGAEYRVDLKEVQSIVHDKHSHISLNYAPIDKGNWGKNMYWMIFRNGAWLKFSPEANSHGAWDTYQEFLKQNPQFLSVP